MFSKCFGIFASQTRVSPLPIQAQELKKEIAEAKQDLINHHRHTSSIEWRTINGQKLMATRNYFPGEKVVSGRHHMISPRKVTISPIAEIKEFDKNSFESRSSISFGK